MEEKQWHPADLPQVPAKAALIRPLEPILGIVFTVLLLILINAASQFIGVYSIGENVVTVTPLLNRKVLALYLPYFNVLLIMAIVKEAVKLIAGKWTIALAGLNAVLNLLSLVLVVTAFGDPGIWHEGFFTYLAAAEFLAEADLEKVWSLFTRVLMGVIAFALIVDSISSLARALKHKPPPAFSGIALLPLEGVG